MFNNSIAKQLIKVENIQSTAIQVFKTAHNDLLKANDALAELIKSEEEQINLHSWNIVTSRNHISKNNSIISKLEGFF